MSPSFIPHELYLIYVPLTHLGRKTHALALSLNKVIHEINVTEQSITPLHWKEILEMLGPARTNLLNTEHPDYSNIFKGKNFSEQDLLEIIFRNPQIVKGPVGILHNKAVVCHSATDILQLDLTPGPKNRLTNFRTEETITDTIHFRIVKVPFFSVIHFPPDSV